MKVQVYCEVTLEAENIVILKSWSDQLVMLYLSSAYPYVVAITTAYRASFSVYAHRRKLCGRKDWNNGTSNCYAHMRIAWYGSFHSCAIWYLVVTPRYHWDANSHYRITRIDQGEIKPWKAEKASGWTRRGTPEMRSEQPDKPREAGNVGSGTYIHTTAVQTTYRLSSYPKYQCLKQPPWIGKYLSCIYLFIFQYTPL